MSPYDPENVFAKMLRGDLPCHKVYEDEHALVAMDIFPQSRGHVLVVPKARSRNLLDANPTTLGAILPLIQRIALAVKAATGADGIRLAQFNEAVAGQTVFHLHFHIIPAYEGVPTYGHQQVRAEDADLAELAKLIAGKIQG